MTVTNYAQDLQLRMVKAQPRQGNVMPMKCKTAGSELFLFPFFIFLAFVNGNELEQLQKPQQR